MSTGTPPGTSQVPHELLDHDELLDHGGVLDHGGWEGEGKRRLRLLHRWGRWTARHPFPVLAGWVVLLALAVLGAGTFGSRLTSHDNEVDGSDSARAGQLVRAAFGSADGETDLVVLSSDTLRSTDPAFRQQVAAVLAAYRGAAGVRGVVGPDARPGTLISRDGRAVLVPVQVAGDRTAVQRAAGPLQQLAGRLSTDRIRVQFTGTAPLAAATIERADGDLGRAEAIGLPVAAVILVIAFGSLVAAALPLTLGVAAVLGSLGVLGLLSGWVGFDAMVRTAVSMVGIALGIDYSLFIVTRFREELTSAGRDRTSTAEAVGRTLNTAGHAVLFSGSTVLVSLAGLFLVRTPSVRALTIGMMVTVLVMLLLAVTLLPALLGLLGQRVNRLALPWADLRPPDPQHSVWGRLAGLVMRRPILVAASCSITLGALAVPALGLHYGVDLGTGAVADTAAGRGFATLSTAFAPGVIAPIDLVASPSDHGEVTAAQTDAVRQLTARLAVDPRVATIDPPVVARTAVRLTIYPAAAPDSAQAADLVGSLRADAVRRLATAGLASHVGGAPAQIVDIAAENSRATPLVIGAVLATSWLLLLLVLRSLVLPVKAIAMNLLSVGAAFGAVVLIFQQGHGAGLLGIDRTGFIQVGLPVLTFAIGFGLSMDYEVFMLSRMREAWQRTADNTAAVRIGITRTARVITSAAAIMVAVFVSFLPTRDLEVKQLGFLLATAVLLDATLIRLLLVPALMRLMGDWNWWLPGRARATGTRPSRGPVGSVR